jgi:hypothetical protein
MANEEQVKRLEYLGIIYAVPVAVVNGWEWFEPEVAEKLWGK